MKTQKPEAERTHRERVYLNHVRRLQARNRELAEMLAEERILRRQAYEWYEQRLMSRLWLLMDAVMITFTGQARSK